MPKAPENLFDMIAKIAADQFPAAKIDLVRSTDIAEDLGADSLDRVDLLMRVERAIGVDVSDDVAERIRTLGEIEDEIRRLCE